MDIDPNYSPRKDWSGSRFGDWTVLKPVGCIRKGYVYDGKETFIVVGIYECKCGGCGLVKPVRMDDLRSNKSKKCYKCSQKSIDREAVSKQRSATRNSKATKRTQKGYWRDLLPEIPPEYVIKLYKDAVKRSLDFQLEAGDVNEAWTRQKGLCVYSGKSLLFKHKDHSTCASVDRIDSSLGYVKGNIQFVSRVINKMKWDLSHEAFLATISTILDYQNGKSVQ